MNDKLFYSIFGHILLMGGICGGGLDYYQYIYNDVKAIRTIDFDSGKIYKLIEYNNIQYREGDEIPSVILSRVYNE